MALQRMGLAICSDMKRPRQDFRILLDESLRIAHRLDSLVPTHGTAIVPRLYKAVLTPILLVRYPDRYGVWNRASEVATISLGL